MDLFSIENLRCSYEHPFIEGRSRTVLEIKSLRLERGKCIFIVGESGIGKSTILETLGMMNNTIVADSNSRFLFHDVDGHGVDLHALWQAGDNRLSYFRLKNFSFIFQNTNLMRNFTAYENVAYTRMLQGYSRQECFERTREVLGGLGLDHVDERRLTQELSGGQQQRLAFARAILPDYTVLFGDEPTGNLDPENAMRVMRILVQNTEAQQNASAIIVSHDMHLATTYADVIIKIRKETRPKLHDKDEDATYGMIDEQCVFWPDTSRYLWTNGDERYTLQNFEEYLRKK